MKILTVDDDKINRFLIKKILVHDLSADVVEAESGFKALEILGAESVPDLAVLDMMMPGMDGIQLLEKIRMNFALRRMKIIMCSALNERLRIAQAYALEIQDYILKPVQSQKLTKAVKIALKLDDSHIPVKAVQTPPVTDLNVYMSQLAGLVQKIDGHIAMIREAANFGDRSTIGDTLKEIIKQAGKLGINRMVNLAEQFDSHVFLCNEETLLKHVDLLAAEQVLLRQTLTGIRPDMPREYA